MNEGIDALISCLYIQQRQDTLKETRLLAVYAYYRCKHNVMEQVHWYVCIMSTERTSIRVVATPLLSTRAALNVSLVIWRPTR